jgi:hypothetical protein
VQVDISSLSCVLDAVSSRLSLRAVVSNVFQPGVLFLMCSCWSAVTPCSAMALLLVSFSGNGMYFLLWWQCLFLSDVSWLLVESSVSDVTVCDQGDQLLSRPKLMKL